MPRIEYDVVFNIQKPKSGGLNFAKDANNAEQLKQEIESTKQEYDGLTNSAKKFSAAQSKTNKQVGRGNAQFAGANQAIFAFGDLVQDSTQFTQGFSQGMRAIGNNVAFAGELFGNLSTRVKQYNASLSQADIQAGKSKTLFGELKQSMMGFGGAIIAVNLAFIAGQIFADNMRRELKDLEEQAKANAEALSEVASVFSEFDTGVPDPFGFRARSREINILTRQLGDFDEKLQKKGNVFAFFSQKFGTNVAGLASLFQNASLSVGTFFNIIDDGTFVSIQASVELQKEIEKQRQVHEAYTEFLNQAGNERLRRYVDLTKEAEQSLIQMSSGVNLNAQSLESLVVQVGNLISGLRNENSLSDEQIILLQKLIELRNDLNEERLRAQRILRATDAIQQENDFIRSNIELIQTHNVIRAASISKKIRDAKITSDIQKQIDSVRDDEVMGVISAEQAKTRIVALETQERLRLKQSEIEKDQEVRKNFVNGIKGVLSASGNLFSALSAASEQRAEQNEASAREEFMNQKKFALSSAIVNAASGIASAFNPYVPVLSELQAGIVAAATKVQISTIKAQEFDGGGAAPSSNNGGGRSSGFITRTGEMEEPSFSPRNNSQKQINITVVGNVDRKGIAYAVKEGNKEINAQRITF